MSSRSSAANGLILGNGGVLTYENAICLSTRPRNSEEAYPVIEKLPLTAPKQMVPPIHKQAAGEAVIEVSVLEAPLYDALWLSTADIYRGV